MGEVDGLETSSPVQSFAQSSGNKKDRKCGRDSWVASVGIGVLQSGALVFPGRAMFHDPIE